MVLRLARSMDRVHRAARLLHALGLLLCAAVTPPAHGSDTDLMFAPPIGPPQLAEYMERLGTSADQQWAIMRMHESYRLAYRRLQERVLEPAIDRLDGIDQSSALPDPAESERAIRAVEAAAQRIAHLDAHLFDEMQEVLSPQQVKLLTRVRMARERVRHRSGSLDMMLSENLDGLDLDDLLRRKGIGAHAPQRESIDGLLDAYEQQLTAEYERMARTSMEFMLGMVDAIRVSGIAPGDELDDESPALERLGEAMMVVRLEAELRLLHILFALRSSALSTSQRIAMSMDPPDGNGFVRAVIAELVGGDQGWQLAAHSPHQDYLWSARRMVGEMDEADAAPITAALDRIAPQVDQRIEHVFELDRQRRGLYRPDGIDYERYDDFSRQINVHVEGVRALYAELAEIMSAHDRAVQSEVSWSDRMRAIGALPGEDALLAARRPQAGAAVPPDPPDPPDPDDPESQAWTGDWSLPSPITRSDLRDLQMLLDLDEAQRVEVERLFDAYRASYRSLESTEQVRQLARRRWSADAQSGAPRLDEEGLQMLRGARRRALADVIAAGDAFLDSVQRAVKAPQHSEIVDVIRSAHRARCQARSVHLWMMPSQGVDQEWMVNPVRLIMGLPHADLNEKRGALLAAAGTLEQLASAAQHAFDAALESQAEQERWQVMSRAAAASGGISEKEDEQMRMRVYELSVPLRTARADMASHVRASVDLMCEVLSPDLARSVQGALIRSAFPTTFDNAPDVDAFTRAALALSDLAAHQREQVQEMHATFRPAFDAYTEQMVEMVRSVSFEGLPAGAAPVDESQRHQAYTDFDRAFKRLMDDRRHLVHRWLFEFRSVLTDAQIRTITTTVGPLPDLASLPGR